MATLTIIQTSVGDASGQARLEVDVNDTTDPLNWDLIALRVVNGMTRPVFIDIQRGNGTSWFTASIPAGQTVERAAGGPVRKESDIPRILLRTV